MFEDLDAEADTIHCNFDRIGVHPELYTLHPTPYTLRPTPYTLHPTPYTLHPTPYTLHPTPYTLHPTPQTHPVQLRPHWGTSYLRLIDFCITQLKAQGPSRTCNESKEEEEASGYLLLFFFITFKPRVE